MGIFEIDLLELPDALEVLLFRAGRPGPGVKLRFEPPSLLQSALRARPVPVIREAAKGQAKEKTRADKAEAKEKTYPPTSPLG